MKSPTSDYLDFVNKVVKLSQNDVELIEGHLRILEFDKRQNILSTNQKCQGLYFVSKGLFRSYRNKDGNDITTGFFAEGDFFTDYYSLFTQSNCQFNLETIEPTTLIFTPYERLLAAYDQSHKLERLGRLMVERALMTIVQIQTFNSNTKAEQKYTEFELKKKELMNRIPLKHLATFFGITPESLSRLRKQRL